MGQRIKEARIVATFSIQGTGHFSKVHLSHFHNIIVGIFSKMEKIAIFKYTTFSETLSWLK